MHKSLIVFFFFNDTATTEIYTLSLHDALPICHHVTPVVRLVESHEQVATVVHDLFDPNGGTDLADDGLDRGVGRERSEEHTSELQSRQYLVCRLLLEKKKTTLFHSLYDNIIT